MPSHPNRTHFHCPVATAALVGSDTLARYDYSSNEEFELWLALSLRAYMLGHAWEVGLSPRLETATTLPVMYTYSVLVLYCT